MNRKQRKSLWWRRFGYFILIIIKFSELLFWISLRFINELRSYTKHSKACFLRYPNTWNPGSASLFQPTSVFGYFMKHSSLCLMRTVYGSWNANIIILLHQHLLSKHSLNFFLKLNLGNFTKSGGMLFHSLAILNLQPLREILKRHLKPCA